MFLFIYLQYFKSGKETLLVVRAQTSPGSSTPHKLIRGATWHMVGTHWLKTNKQKKHNTKFYVSRLCPLNVYCVASFCAFVKRQWTDSVFWYNCECLSKHNWCLFFNIHVLLEGVCAGQIFDSAGVVLFSGKISPSNRHSVARGQLVIMQLWK